MRIGRTNEALPPPPAPLAPESAPDVEAAAPGGADRVASASESSATGATHAFGRLLRGLGQELDRGENLAEKAIRGGHAHASLSPERLIALQAGIYRNI
jgi:hypothetical protein